MHEPSPGARVWSKTFCDFGPIFEEWEADFGRPYVLADDPVKLRLRDDLPVMFDAGRRFSAERPGFFEELLDLGLDPA